MKKPFFLKKAMDPIIMNGKAHDRDADKYDEKHIEIYNPTEQKRIHHVLKDALKHIKTKTDLPRVLDFGAGTGNLTEHLMGLGVKVVAADISLKYLERLRRKLGKDNSKRLETMLLNGNDLSGISNGSLDMVATYSVLHHVPDYLKIIDEFVRVLKTGGIVYIDHEVCPSYWEQNAEYQAYLEELGSEFRIVHLKELGITSHDHKIEFEGVWKKFFPFSKWIKQAKGRPSSHQKRKIPKGGDLHVYKDDHLAWDNIESRLSSQCEIIKNVDYLVCRERDEIPKVWGKWQSKCADMHMIIAGKR
jgi:ubiquinone/menaquinone biosynthesis C-methylase UbiE